MTRTANRQDLYRHLQDTTDVIRRQQSGLLQGQVNPYIYDPCDYSLDGLTNLTINLGSINDVEPGAATIGAQAGQRYLIFQQLASKVDNGIYVLGNDGFLRRSDDMPAGKEIKAGSRIYVNNGYRFGNREFFVRNDAVVGSTPLDIWPAKGTLLDSQVIRGNGTGYVAVTSTNYIILRPTGSMVLTYTPPVDVEWKIDGRVGILQKLDAAYHYMYSWAALNPADIDGKSNGGRVIDTQNSAVNVFSARVVSDTFRLAAGTTYTINLVLGDQSGGSWQHSSINDYLSLQASAFVR